MASSAASSSSSGKDAKIINLLALTLQKLDDFKGRSSEAAAYAAQVVVAVRANNETEAEFKDQIMCIVANVKNLNGAVRASEQDGDSGIAAADLAVMDANAMRSGQQKKAMAATFRKRAREQTNIDKTSLHCTKCGLVRRDRLNINELALDSEESGSHFDYNFDNVCTCSHSSDEEQSSSDEEGDGSDAAARSRSRSSTVVAR